MSETQTKATKWLRPFRRNLRNFENVGCLPFALEHDRGFGGDKLYSVVLVRDDGFRRILADGPREQLGPFYHRRDAMAAIKRVEMEHNHPEQFDPMNHTR